MAAIADDEMMKILLSMLIRELESKSAARRLEAETVARRFIRSVARIFVIINVEMTPLGKKGVTPSHLESCREVFTSLITLAVEELFEVASSQIALLSDWELPGQRHHSHYSMRHLNLEAKNFSMLSLYSHTRAQEVLAV